jgi:hypothetical protein
MYDTEAQARTAIEHERQRVCAAVDADLTHGGPLRRGLTLFALQLVDLEWDDLDLQIDLANRIVIFPNDKMLSIPQTHRFFDALIGSGAAGPSSCYDDHLQAFQQKLLLTATP